MITVFGASDDLIEIEGDIDEEFNVLGDEDDGWLLAFSNGTVLRVKYTKGVWRITMVTNIGELSIEQAPEDDEDNYTDVATLNADVKWCVLGSQVALKR